MDGVQDFVEDNFIAGNGGHGISLGSNVYATTIKGNTIGRSYAANGGSGIHVNGAYSNTIGDTSVYGRNTIAYNGDDGVTVVGSGATRNRIRGNRIYANSDLGIDLNDDGVTANDSFDVDSGPNGLQNYPVLTSTAVGSFTTVAGFLNSTPNRTFTLDFYRTNSQFYPRRCLGEFRSTILPGH